MFGQTGGAAMGRSARAVSETGFYHIMIRGSGKQIIFEDDRDRTRMVETLKRYLKMHRCEIHAWCLMDNHVHLLLHDPHGNMSDLMHAFETSYARYFNDKTGHVGHVFQDRFRSVPIADERQLLATVRYIHENPLDMGRDPRTYRWSSYREYLGEPEIALRITSTAAVLEIAGGHEQLVDLHEDEGQPRYAPITGRDMGDDESRRAIDWLLYPISAASVKTLPSNQRNAALRRLRAAGLSIKQIGRITGIGESTISRATVPVGRMSNALCMK